MANEFIARKGLIALNNSQVTGSLDITGNITANNLTGTNTGDQDLSSYIQNSQTGSMSVATASLANEVAFTNITDKPTLISSSAQVDHDLTANFDAAEHFTQANITTVGTVTSGDVSAILPSGTVSSSAQIATNISGAFTSTSASIASDITTNTSNISTNTTDIATLTAATSSYLTTVDISDDTNLTGGTNLTLSGDTMNLDANISLTSITASSDISASGTIVGSNLSGTNTGDQDLSSYIQNSQTSSMSVATASLANEVAYTNITGKPTLVSSSAQIDHDATTNFDAAEHFTQANITEVGTVTSGDVSAILPVGTVSSSAQIDHDATTNFDAAEHFTQANITEVGTVTSGDVSAILPTGTVSGSSQINLGSATGTVDISSQTNLVGGTNLTLSGDTMNLDANISLTSITASSDISASGTTSQIIAQNIVGGSYKFLDRKFAGTSTTDSFGVELGNQGDGNLLLTHLTASGNISASGTIVGSNLSGTNTGDQDLSSYIQASQTESMSVATASYIDAGNINGTIDISDQTNLTAGNGITLTDDTLTVAAGTGLNQNAGGLSFDADGGSLTTNNADVDHILINDGGTFKRIAKGNINVGDFNNDAGYLTTVDISTDTNLVGGTNLTLSGDTMNLDANISLTDITASIVSASYYYGTPLVKFNEYAFRYESNTGVIQNTGLLFNGTTGQYEFLDPTATCVFCIKAGSGDTTIYGNLTASLDISASGNIFANTSDAAGASYNTLMVDTTTGQFYHTGSYGGGGGGASITGTDTHVLFFDGNDNPAGDAGFTYNKTTNSITSITHITASGEISSSDKITANSYYLNDHVAIGEQAGEIRFGFENVTPISIGKTDNPITLHGNVQAVGIITASGGISSSNDITGINIIASSDITSSNILTKGQANIDKINISRNNNSGGSLAVAGDYGFGSHIYYQNSTSTTAGKVYFLNGTNWTLASSGSETSASGFLGIAAETNSSGGMVIQGSVVTNNSGTSGTKVYLADEGNLTTTRPTTTGHFVRIVGYIVNNGTVYFNPSTDYIELA